MPRFTGAILALSASTRNTTSMGFGFSPFLSARPTLVLLVDDVLVEDAIVELVDPDERVLPGCFAFAAGLLVASFGNRVVTLAIGTDRTFVCDRVSISAVTDMP